MSRQFAGDEGEARRGWLTIGQRDPVEFGVDRQHRPLTGWQFEPCGQLGGDPFASQFRLHRLGQRGLQVRAAGIGHHARRSARRAQRAAKPQHTPRRPDACSHHRRTETRPAHLDVGVKPSLRTNWMVSLAHPRGNGERQMGGSGGTLLSGRQA